MSWLEYYRLLEKYNGDLQRASGNELAEAARGNPNDPISALTVARRKYLEDKNDNRPD